MGKVVIDYEKFKDVLGDYLAKNLIDEIISCMNDNLVFIEDIDSKVTITDDGTILGTRLLIDGEDISKETRRIEYVKEAGEAPVLHIEMLATDISISTECIPELPDIYKPYYKRIEPQ
ncbi:MAG: hypothetical protein UF228_06770 [Lachnospiraceae bacterium]|nr:hypothetical protein [Lachnospiraceae bacterium]